MTNTTKRLFSVDFKNVEKENGILPPRHNKSEQPVLKVVRFIKSKIYTKIPRKSTIEKKYGEPWLNDRGGDLSKNWYVGYKVWDQKNNKWKYPQEYISSKKFKTAKERYERGDILIRAITELLKEHFTKDQNDSVENDTYYIIPAIEAALENIKSKLEKTTYNSYRSAANKLVDWISENELQGLYVNEFNVQYAAKYCQYLGRAVKSNRTFNNNKTDLSGIFKELKKSMHLIDHNPWPDIDSRKVSESSHGIWTANDLKRYLQYTKENNKQLYVASLLLFHVFGRPIELCRLKVKDFELHKGLVWFEIKKGQTYRREPGSLSQDLINVLKPLLIDLPSNLYFFSTDLGPGENKIHPQRFGDVFRTIREQLNFEREESIFYELKHTGVSIAVANNIPLRNIQLQCRHTAFSTTEKYVRNLQVVNDSHFKNFPNLKHINY